MSGRRKCPGEYDRGEYVRRGNVWIIAAYLGVIECVYEILIIQNVSLGLKQQFEDAVFNRLELSLVGVDLDNQLVPLLLEIRSLQTHNIAAQQHQTVIHKLQL